MKTRLRLCLVALAIFCVTTASAQQCKPGTRFVVKLAPEFKSTYSGRLLVFMTSGPKRVLENIDPFGGEAKLWATATEVHNLRPGTSVELSPNAVSSPRPFAEAPAGKYKVRAILDATHHWGYHSVVKEGDLSSEISEHALPAQCIEITLTNTHIAVGDGQLVRTSKDESWPFEDLSFQSSLLTASFGRPRSIRGAVVLPPSYSKDKEARYPTVYVTQGFGSNLNSVRGEAQATATRLANGAIPEMIYVVLDQSWAWGTHEFANSANNGPWGDALVNELIPYLESQYRMDAKPSGRFLTGHSSGGWTSLWLQVAYPDTFGGTWPTAPDPVDFRSFTNIDVTRDTNAYRKPDGSPRYVARQGKRDFLTFEYFARLERVLGEYGGQLRSFEAVFSPRGEDLQPMRLFDRDTGEIDRTVANAWAKYDISRIVRENWTTLAPRLNGKIHITVGTEDTFYLDEPTRLFEQELKKLGGNAEFRYIQGKNHMNLYSGGLAEKIAREMYAVARPEGEKAKAAGAK